MKILRKEKKHGGNMTVTIADYISDKFKTKQDGLAIVYYIAKEEGHIVKQIRIDEIGDIEDTRVDFIYELPSLQELIDTYGEWNLDTCTIETIRNGELIYYFIFFYQKKIRIGCDEVFNQEAEELLFEIEKKL